MIPSTQNRLNKILIEVLIENFKENLSTIEIINMHHIKENTFFHAHYMISMVNSWSQNPSVLIHEISIPVIFQNFVNFSLSRTTSTYVYMFLFMRFIEMCLADGVIRLRSHPVERPLRPPDTS